MKLSAGQDPWIKAHWVQDSKIPTEIVTETWATCFVLGQCLPRENPDFLWPVHPPRVQTVSCGQGTVSLEWMSVPQLCVPGVTVCCLNSYKRKTGPFLLFQSVLPVLLLSCLTGGQLFQRCFSHLSWPALNSRSRTRTVESSGTFSEKTPISGQAGQLNRVYIPLLEKNVI